MEAKNVIIARTIAIVAVSTISGMYLEMYGPTLIDLKILYKTNYETVARAVTGRGSGGFIGSLIGGVLVDRYEGQLDLLVGLPQMVAAAAVLLVPLAPGITAMWGLVNITGVVGGMIGIAFTRQLVLMWKEKAAFYILLVSIGCPIGALLGPVLCRPFLAEIDFSASGEKGGLEDEAGTSHVLIESTVQTAFLIVAVLAFLSAIPFLLFPRVKQANPHNYAVYEKVSKEDLDNMAPTIVTKTKFTFNSCMSVLILLFYLSIGGATSVFGVFVRSLAADLFQFSSGESSNLNILFWTSVIGTRVVGTLATSAFHIRTLVTLQCSVYSIGSTLVMMYAASSRRALWTCAVILGVSQSTVYSSGLAYFNFRLDMDGKCLMLISFASYIGDLSFIWGAGRLYDMYGPVSILNFIVAGSVIGLVVITVLRLTEQYDGSLKKRGTGVLT